MTVTASENSQITNTRRHAWKAQRDANGDRYFYCTRERCGAIWSPVHDGATEPVGCAGKSPANNKR